MKAFTMQVPDDAVRYILFQRTGHSWLTNNRWCAKFFLNIAPAALYRNLVGVEALVRKTAIKQSFSAHIQAEYAELRPFLPAQVSSVLDIGCGVAGIDVWLQQHYGPAAVIDYYLLDKTDVAPKVYFGYKPQAAFYNSLAISHTLLSQNGIPAQRVHLLEATPDNQIALTGPVDLAISLISWGFHYPVATYLDRVYELLRVGGTLILDVRKGTGGEEQLRKKFGNMQLIAESRAHLRLLLCK